MSLRQSARTTLVSLPGARTSRTPTVAAAFLSNLFGGGGPGSSAGPDPRGKELATELSDLTQGTERGVKASPAKKERISEIVSELNKYSIKSPAKSPQLWGEYEVLYSSQAAPGGPQRQVLEASGQVTNSAEFKSFGLLPGYSRTFGQLAPVSGSADTLQLTLERSESKTGLGGPVEAELDTTLRVRIVYLDATLRVTVSSEEGGLDEVCVYRRVAPASAKRSAAADEDSDDEEAAPSPPARGGFKAAAGGTQPLKASPAVQRVDPQAALKARDAAAAARAKDAAGKAKEQEVARRDAEATKARAEADKAAERERQEAGKVAERQRAATAKAQLAQLADELREASAQAKETVADLREAERESAAILKGASAAEAQVARAASEVSEAEAQLAEAAGLRRGAEAALRDALAAVAALR